MPEELKPETAPKLTKEELAAELESIEKKQLFFKRLDDILRHLSNVHKGAELLGRRLINQGEYEFGKSLIARSFLHDQTKFYAHEWEHLHRDVDEDELRRAHLQHVQMNDHHPEFWGGIKLMPRIAIAEMVVDWKARSTEMGTDLRLWVKDVALPKYDISPNGKYYKEIKYFLDLLLDEKFS